MAANSVGMEDTSLQASSDPVFESDTLPVVSGGPPRSQYIFKAAMNAEVSEEFMDWFRQLIDKDIQPDMKAALLQRKQEFDLPPACVDSELVRVK